VNVTAIKVDNGVNVEALLWARQALSEAPEAARFKWRATCSWINGTHSRSAVQSFFGRRDPQMAAGRADRTGDRERRRAWSCSTSATRESWRAGDSWTTAIEGCCAAISRLRMSA
jgi:hypothetical protein